MNVCRSRGYVHAVLHEFLCVSRLFCWENAVSLEFSTICGPGRPFPFSSAQNPEP